MNEQSTPSKGNILVVDDAPDILEPVADLLSIAGYTVRTAPSGILALTSVQSILPDLILLDIMMPEMNGYEVCQTLKASPTTQDIPVIFISALNETLDKVKVFEVGGIDYIPKPFQQEEIVARIENQLRQTRLSKQLQEQNTRLQREIETCLQVQLVMERQLHRSQIIGQITDEIRSHLDATAFFESAATQLGQAFGASRALIHCYIAQPTPIIPLLGQYLAPDYTALMNVELLVVGNPHIERLLSQDRAIAVSDVYAEPLLENTQSLCQQLEIKSMLGVRTSYQDKPNGLIWFHQCDCFREWTQEEIELIEAIAAQLGIAIAQAQLLEQEKQARTELNRQNLQLQQEIADRKQAEEKLQHREAQLNTIVTNISDGILILDRQSRVLFANPAAAILLNLPLEDLIGYEWGIPVGQTAEINLVSSSGKNRVAEMRVARTQWLGLSAYIVALRDINDHKLAEEALRRSEAREREKAQALELALDELKRTQVQLIQTEKMSSLGRMVAGIAHEINNPVGFIHSNLTHARCYFQNLLNLIRWYQKTYPNPTPEIQQFVEEIDLNFIEQDWQKMMNSIQVGTERICQIVLSLRNFSRLDENQLKSVDIHEGIDSTLLILQHRLRNQGNASEIEVIKDYSQLPKVTCYASQLNQVFLNLLSNAIDALEEKLGVMSQESRATPTITIRTDIRTKDSPFPSSQWIVIRIADNGCGMSEEILPQIFDPFFTTKPVGSGTGLGLAISYQIVVEKHKGYIRCVSAPGQGTEFIVEIPVDRIGVQQKINVFYAKDQHETISPTLLVRTFALPMIVTLVSLKGGVGKTTSAIHIAAYLQQKGPTLLIDADKNRSALVWDRESQLPFKVVSEAAAPRFVKQHQYIVIDTQARPSVEELKDLAQGCDLMILPTTPKALDMDALNKTVELLDGLNAKFKILLTQVPPRSSAARKVRQSLEEAGLPVFASDIPRLVAFERAPIKGVLVKDYADARSQMAWESYNALGKEILP